MTSWEAVAGVCVGGGEGTAGPRRWEAQRPLPWENREHAAGDLGYRFRGQQGSPLHERLLGSGWCEGTHMRECTLCLSRPPMVNPHTTAYGSARLPHTACNACCTRL